MALVVPRRAQLPPLRLIALLALPVAPLLGEEIPLSTVALRPEQVTAVGTGAIFVSQDEEGRRALWGTDGTPGGTHLILDPCPSPCDGTPLITILGSTLDGRAYFHAIDPALPALTANLWVTDGSVHGTHPILQASQVTGLPFPAEGTSMIVGSRLLFTKSGFGETVWATDGSPNSAGPLGGVSPTQDFDRIDYCGADSRIGYFRRVRIGEGGTLFRTDGTGAGTSAPAEPNSFDICRPSVMSGGRLWGGGYVEGIEEPTFLVTDASVAGSRHSDPLPALPHPVEASDGAAVFLLREGEEAIPSLWTSDGTPAGTRRLKQGSSWESFEYSYTAEMFEIVRPFVYYLYNSDSGALEARRVRLDGTDDRLIQRLCDSNCGYDAEFPWIELVGDAVVFPAVTPSTTTDLYWLEHGTTIPVEIASPCSSIWCEFRLDFHQVIGSRLLYVYWDELLGDEMLAFDPSRESVSVLSHFSSGAPFAHEDNGSDLLIADGRLLTPAFEVDAQLSRLFALPAFEICRTTSLDLCLRDERFKVEVRWRNFAGGEGSGQALSLTTDTGYFWFFDDSNVELTVKVLDGTGLNGHFWVYYGALSNVEYWITVEDTVTGESKQYHNELGQFGSFGDIEALPAGPGTLVVPVTSGAASPRATVESPEPNPLVVRAFGSSGTCIPTSTSLCLLDGRFQVEAEWTDFAGNSGVAYVEQLTPDTGYFWFFSESNVEIVAKLVDGSAFNQHFWVYYGALSNVEYTLTVTDTVAGGPPRIYRNPLGQFGSFGDIEAFPAP